MTIISISQGPVPQSAAASLIDLGPFYDRFGDAKMAVLTSQDPGVKAIISDTQIRAWIDLSRPDVAAAISYIATVVPELTEAIQQNSLATPVSAEDNLVLRKTYFS